jgi:hypothetical protein
MVGEREMQDEWYWCNNRRVDGKIDERKVGKTGNMTAVVMPSDVTSIGGDAFCNLQARERSGMLIASRFSPSRFRKAARKSAVLHSKGAYLWSRWRSRWAGEHPTIGLPALHVSDCGDDPARLYRHRRFRVLRLHLS